MKLVSYVRNFETTAFIYAVFLRFRAITLTIKPLFLNVFCFLRLQLVIIGKYVCHSVLN
jgi:hypothetical protein